MSATPDRRVVLGGLAALAAAPLARAQTPDASVGFVVIGDWGRMGAPVQSAVAAAMAKAAAQIDSRFVISVGDNFYPSGVRSTKDSHWKSSFEDVYVQPSLQTPWYVATGNHDYRGSVHSQIAYTQVSTRWRMPDRRFRMNAAEVGAPQVDLFFIDTTPMLRSYDEQFQRLMHGRKVSHHPGRSTRHQLEWLDQQLAASTAPWKIVVGHHPIYSGGHGDNPVLVDGVAPLLEKHGVQAYLFGHDHNLQHIRRGNVDYVCSGAGSSVGEVGLVQGTKFCLAKPGFAMFTLDGDVLRLEFRDAAGKTLYHAPIRRAA